jgi:CubicO group peptidase (beta-lactamase class C family)
MIDATALDNITDDKFRAICEEAVNKMNRLSIPGAVIGVLYEDKEFIAPFGITSIEHPLPVTEDTLFQIGSITKTYLATAVMRLVDTGKLELDKPIRTYLPDLKLADETVAASVTMRQLLTHTGGWVGDYFNDFGPGEDALSKMVIKMADLQQLTPLGQIFSYSNSGFYLAGRVIEVVMGTNFEAAIKELVLNPLGLKMSFFFSDDVVTHRFAVGHEVIGKEPKVARPWAIGRAQHPSGGIICTIHDLFRYARFHMGDGTTSDGTRLLSKKSLELMQTPMFPSTGISMIGLSWAITIVNVTKMISHSGGTNGQVSYLRIVPSRKLAVAIFINSNEGGALCFETANSATNKYLDLTLPEALPLHLPEEQLLSYVGKYDAASEICEIYFRDAELFLQITDKGGFPTPDSPPPQSPPPVRVALYADDQLIVLDEPLKDARGEFLRSPDNSIAWFRFYSRVHARQG